MAAVKYSLVCISSQAAVVLLFLVVALAAQAQTAQAQSCTAELNNLNVCAPYVVPGAANAIPNADCCGALRGVHHDCLCSTLRIASQLPSLCNLPPLTCGNGTTYAFLHQYYLLFLL
jgi:hypothetical protein